MIWNFFHYSFHLEGHTRKVNMCNKVLSRNRLNKEPPLPPPSLQSGSSQPEQNKRSFAKTITHPGKMRIRIPITTKLNIFLCTSHINKKKKKVLGEGSTTQMRLTCVHGSFWAAVQQSDWRAYLGVPNLQHQALQELQPLFATHFTRVPPAGGEEGGLGQRNHAGSHQADPYCFYQGLNRACSTGMGIHKSHMNKMQLPQHVASAGMSLGGVQTHQAMRPTAQAQTGASFIR